MKVTAIGTRIRIGIKMIRNEHTISLCWKISLAFVLMNQIYILGLQLAKLCLDHLPINVAAIA